MTKKRVSFDTFTSANAITMFRIFAAPVFLFFLISLPQKISLLRWLSGIIFVVIALTDLLDGYLARKKRQVSQFGKCLDHIADKILVVLILLALVKVKKANLFPTTIIFLREITISGIREFLALENKTAIPVTSLSKTKTAFQMTAITILLVASHDGFLLLIGNATLWVSAGLAAVTMYDHLKSAFSAMSGGNAALKG